MSHPAKKSKLDDTDTSTELLAPLQPRTLTAQDACLHNLDLLETILSSVAALDAPKKTIRAVALTCKGFYPSAVKVLWATLTNILPLPVVRLLPGLELPLHGREEYILPGFISASEWAVFDRHAAYVREIEYPDLTNFKRVIPPAVYARLALREQPLLPNMRRLTVNLPCQDMEMLLCLTSVTTSLTVRLSSHTGQKEKFLEVVSERTPQLSHLSLTGHNVALFSMPRLFQNLRTLELRNACSSLTAAVLVDIGSIPQLTSLTMDTYNWTVDFDSIRCHSILCALTSLKIIYVSKRPQCTICDILLCIGAPAMQCITIVPLRNCIQVEGQDGRTAFAAIVECIRLRWAASLIRLDLHNASASCDDLSALRSLKLSKLRKLSLRSVIGSPLSDERVLALVQSFVNLRTLSLTGGGNADIVFLQAVAQRCPALRTLYVPFFPDARLPDVPRTRVRAHGLRKLQFEHANHEWANVDLQLLARHVYRLFPRITSITGTGGGDMARIKEVQNMVQICQDARSIEWEQ
ncbi:hypothetical protein GGX14DRAFT_582074 [Mycena pura]|uniref:F-box domain-containing protein n=1 Tax=Mycena pura TaxID=153505 RepID=A0AAD7E5J7_9AGAR|nr:hypothetical protein GGX14DRAFT_582074 [Mycena pura]